MGQQPITLRRLFELADTVDESRWQAFHPGIEIIRLYGDGQSGPAAALLRYQPGAQLARHVHSGYEHIFVLRGGQQDENGSYGPGDCLINPPDTSHAVSSPQGCVVLAIWGSPVQFPDAT